MKKLYSYLLFFIFFQTAFPQKIRDTVSSQILKENREIYISLPASYQKSPKKSYPLLLLLDGDYLLEPFQGTLNYGAYWDDLPEVIIVGICQNKKKERYTDCSVNQETGVLEDKAEDFLGFIRSELLTHIQKKYRVAPFKIIAGHDITAGFLNFYLYDDKPIFDAYISLSPELSIGMDDQILERLSSISKPIYYYHSIADGDIKKMKEKIQKLDAGLKEIKRPNLNYRFDEFKGASHYSLVLYSIPNALYQFFASYQPISMEEFNEKIAILPSGYSEYLAKKYDFIEKSLGIKTPIRVNDFRAIEAAILMNKDYNDFDALSILARKSHPLSMMADYDLAMMYEKKGDNKNAVKYYLLAYQKEEIGSLTKSMMFDKAETLKKTYSKKGKQTTELETVNEGLTEELKETEETKKAE